MPLVEPAHLSVCQFALLYLPSLIYFSVCYVCNHRTVVGNLADTVDLLLIFSTPAHI